MDYPQFVLLWRWITGIVLLLSLHFEIGDASCTYKETQGYIFKRVSREHIKKRGDSVLELQFSVKALASAHVRVIATDDEASGTVDSLFFITRYTYELNIDYQNHLSFEHVGVMGPTVTQPRNLISATEIRPFWLRFNVSSGFMSFGRIGQPDPLISWQDPGYIPRKSAAFSIASLRSTLMDAVWIFCDDWEYDEDVQKMQAGLNCKSMATTKINAPSWYMDAKDEFVAVGDKTHYHLAIEKGISPPFNATVHFFDSTREELFKVIVTSLDVTFSAHHDSSVQVFNSKESVHCFANSSTGVEPLNKLQSISLSFSGSTIMYTCGDVSWSYDAHLVGNLSNISFVRFSSNTTAKLHWLHGCKGIQSHISGPATTNTDEAMKQTLAALYSSIFKTAPSPSKTWSSPEEVVENIQRTCRVVQTFKPAYDQFFEMREAGTINGSFSRLLFTAWGSNFRIKLTEEMPVAENYYEIFLGIANSTTISRSGDSAAAYVDTESLWKENTLQQFVIEHDAATGDINIIHKNDTVLTWRDPKGFPVRFFSVTSGVATGKVSNTTWIFGCDKRPLSCYSPVHANQYLYSQFFWLNREGKFSAEKNETTLEFWVRVKNSAHLRLEPMLPYIGHPPATVEFDFGVDDRINLDINSRRVASQKVTNPVNANNYTGYWIRQHLGTGGLELGSIGQTKVLLRYNAHGRLRPLLFFSGTNSQRAGNSTWVFGCTGADRPGQEDSSPGEDYSLESESDYIDLSIDGITDEIMPKFTTKVPTSTNPRDSHSSTAGDQNRTPSAIPSPGDAPAFSRWILRNLKWIPPTGNTSITGHFRISQMVLNDKKDEMVLEGSLSLEWRRNITWHSSSTVPSLIKTSAQPPPGWILRDLFATVGKVTVDMRSWSDLIQHSNGILEINLRNVKVEPTCHTDVSSWPRDSKSCTFALALWSRQENLELQRVFVEINSTEAGWTKPTITEDNTLSKMRVATRSAMARKVHLHIHRRGEELFILCLAPLILTSFLVLLCGLVRTLIGNRVSRTLRERLILLGSANFILTGFAIWIHEKVPVYHKAPPTMLGAYLWSIGIVTLFMAVSLLIGSRISSGSPPSSWLVQLFSGKIISHLLCLTHASIAASNQGVQFKSDSDEVYLSTTAAADGEQCTSSESPTTRDQQVSWFWSWQLVITGLDRVVTTICFACFLAVIIMVL